MNYYIGLDLGKKSLGIATCATGLVVTIHQPFFFKYRDYKTAVQYLKQHFGMKKHLIFVIGNPISLNASENEQTKEVDYFIDLLKTNFAKEIQIIKFDERLTSKIANNTLKEMNYTRKNRNKLEDSVAASIILKDYLDQQNS